MESFAISNFYMPIIIISIVILSAVLVRHIKSRHQKVLLKADSQTILKKIEETLKVPSKKKATTNIIFKDTGNTSPNVPKGLKKNGYNHAFTDSYKDISWPDDEKEDNFNYRPVQ